MEKNEVKGRAKQMGGKAREVTGKVTGNERQEARGRAKRTEGKVQEKVGKVQGKVKDVGRAITGD